jgi:hypothetical protein
LALLLVSGSVGASVCRDLNVTGETYVLANNVNSTVTCFNVSKANVTLDCAGFSLTGNNATGQYGVYSTVFNTTIKNCWISNFSTGVYLNNATNATVDNVSAFTSKSFATSNGLGLYVLSGRGHLVANSYFFSVSGRGFFSQAGVLNFYSNITANSTTGYGAFLNSSNATIVNLTGVSLSNYGVYFLSNYSAIINSTGISNSSYGFLVSAYRSVVSDSEGIAATNYGFYVSLTYFSNFSNVTGVSPARFAFVLGSSNYNSVVDSRGFGGASAASNGFYLSGAAFNTLSNVNGSSLNGRGLSFFLSTDNVVSGCRGVSNNSYGIEFLASSSNVLNDCFGSSNRTASLFFSTASSNNVSRFYGVSTGTLAVGAGVYLDPSGGSTDNLFVDSVFVSLMGVRSNTTGINNFTNCTFNKSSSLIGSTGRINVFWYAWVHSIDGSNADLGTVNVNVSNALNASVLNLTTNATGWVYATVWEYMQNKTAVYNQTPHNFTGSKAGYFGNYSVVAVFENVLVTLKLVSTAPPPVVVVIRGFGGGCEDWFPKRLRVGLRRLNWFNSGVSRLWWLD